MATMTQGSVMVEDFLEEQIEDATPDQLEGSLALINKMELKGQKELLGKAGTQVPFRKITQEENVVFRCLFPKETKLKDFSAGPIPPRALEIADRAVSCGLFSDIVVWHPEEVKKDPVMLGVMNDAKYTWQKTYYLLVRWGEALEEMPAMIKRVRQKIKADLQMVKARVELDLSIIDSINIEKITKVDPSYNGFCSL